MENIFLWMFSSKILSILARISGRFLTYVIWCFCVSVLEFSLNVFQNKNNEVNFLCLHFISKEEYHLNSVFVTH